jgi:hypothetical protein
MSGPKLPPADWYDEEGTPVEPTAETPAKPVCEGANAQPAEGPEESHLQHLGAKSRAVCGQDPSTIQPTGVRNPGLKVGAIGVRRPISREERGELERARALLPSLPSAPSLEQVFSALHPGFWFARRDAMRLGRIMRVLGYRPIRSGNSTRRYIRAEARKCR